MSRRLGKEREGRKPDVNPVSMARLENELERLKIITKKGLGLRLAWQPDARARRIY